jgi:clan AA aspartic protease
MGKVFARVTITNYFDNALARRGMLPPEEVRSVTLDSGMVDTGATTLCLPADLFAKLGIDDLEEVQVGTATGQVTARLAPEVLLTVEGRSRTVECLELPGGQQPLLGVFPLEILGIELDLRNKRLILLPDRGPGTYLTIL